MSDRSLTSGEGVARSLPGEGMEGWRRGAKECSVGKGLNRTQAGPRAGCQGAKVKKVQLQSLPSSLAWVACLERGLDPCERCRKEVGTGEDWPEDIWRQILKGFNGRGKGPQ